jgi:hypothetical protein
LDDTAWRLLAYDAGIIDSLSSNAANKDENNYHNFVKSCMLHGQNSADLLAYVSVSRRLILLMSYDGVLGGFLGHGKAGLAIIGKYGILKIPPKEIHGKLQGTDHLIGCRQAKYFLRQEDFRSIDDCAASLGRH